MARYKKRPPRGQLPHICHVKLAVVEKRLLRAIKAADRHGYTGMIGKGSAFDDPRVKGIMRRRDQLLAGKCGKR